MKLSALYQIFLDCQLVTTDSRNCPEGSLFIALKGESFNGNAFAGKALETGCAYAVIDEPEYAIEGDQRYILVDDCLHIAAACQLPPPPAGYTSNRYHWYQRQDDYEGTDLRRTLSEPQHSLYAR